MSRLKTAYKDKYDLVFKLVLMHKCSGFVGLPLLVPLPVIALNLLHIFLSLWLSHTHLFIVTWTCSVGLYLSTSHILLFPDNISQTYAVSSVWESVLLYPQIPSLQFFFQVFAHMLFTKWVIHWQNCIWLYVYLIDYLGESTEWKVCKLILFISYYEIFFYDLICLFHLNILFQ